MNTVKLKKLFVLCLIGLIILIITASCNIKEVMNPEEKVVSTNTNVEEVHKLEEFNYNNLSTDQKNYLNTLYFGNIKFTQKGVEIYFNGVEYRKFKQNYHT